MILELGADRKYTAYVTLSCTECGDMWLTNWKRAEIDGRYAASIIEWKLAHTFCEVEGTYDIVTFEKVT